MNKLDEEIFNYYEKLAPDYDHNRFGNTYGAFINTQEERLLSPLLHSKKCVLDLACGTGRFLKYAHEGLDVSPAMLQEAKEKYPEKALYCASAWEIPVPEAYYDAVCSMHLLMHLTKVRFRDILTEVHRVLQPNGLFIFDLPAAWRRRKLQYTSKGWHGNTAYDIPEIKSFLGNNWEFVDYKGILLLPIHQFPKPIRKQFLRLDAFLNKYFLKYYASYYLITLRKKP